MASQPIDPFIGTGGFGFDEAPEPQEAPKPEEQPAVPRLRPDEAIELQDDKEEKQTDEEIAKDLDTRHQDVRTAYVQAVAGHAE